MLRVIDIFDIEKINGIKIKAGINSVEKEIYNVNIIENPDSYSWFTAGDFILTTGYIFKDDEAEQIKLVEELVDQNAAGLGIKIKRYWQEIPKVIIDKANELNLPVIEIPFNYSLAEVMNAINEVLFNRENSSLNKYRQIHNSYRIVQVEGGSYNEIMEISAKIVNNSLMFLDENFVLLSCYENENNPKPFNNYFKLDINEKIFPQEFTKDLPTDPSMLSLSIKKVLSVDDDLITLRIKPVILAKKIYGYIIVWETVKKLEKLDYIALEVAAQNLAIEMKRLTELEEFKNRSRYDFFDNLVNGRILSLSSLNNFAIQYGIYPNNNHIIAVFNIFDDVIKNKDIAKNLSDFLKAYKGLYKLHVINKLDKIIVLVDVGNESKITKIMKDELEKIVLAINERYNIKYKVGVSTIFNNLVNTKDYINLVLDVVKMFEKSDNIIAYYEDIISYHLLRNNIELEDKKMYVENTIMPLINYDLAHNDNLYETLKIYFESNNNIAITASKMYTHRNTVIYRLNKIKNILNVDLSNGESNFTINLAIKIYEVMKKET